MNNQGRRAKTPRTKREGLLSGARGICQWVHLFNRDSIQNTDRGGLKLGGRWVDPSGGQCLAPAPVVTH